MDRNLKCTYALIISVCYFGPNVSNTGVIWLLTQGGQKQTRLYYVSVKRRFFIFSVLAPQKFGLEYISIFYLLLFKSVAIKTTILR
jgi:hypothetical protein